MPDRRTPFTIADEKRTLVEFLDYLRESMVIKARGLDPESVRRAMVPSGTNLLWLLKHLTTVEIAWFQFAFAGADVEVPSDRIAEDDTADGVIERYRAATARNNEIVDACSDLDRLCARAGTAPQPMTLRWVLIHMVEETARHAGHADILREQIDGQTGR